MQLTVKTIQIGPDRWTARVYAGDVCVYNDPRHPTPEAALEAAESEIDRREAAIREAAELAKRERAREDAIKLVIDIATGRINDYAAGQRAVELLSYLSPESPFFAIAAE